MPDGTLVRNVPEGTTKSELLRRYNSSIEGDDVEQAEVLDIPQQKQRSKLEKGVNLAASYAQGRTFGAGPKFAAGLGSLIAKPILEGVELATGRHAPSLSDLYKSGVGIYSKPMQTAREETPGLAALAEIFGGVKTGVNIAKTGAAQSLGRISGYGGLPGRAAAGFASGELAQRAYEGAEAPVGEELSKISRPSVGLGGVLGGALPVAGAGLSRLGKVITPAVSDTGEKVINLAKKYKIPLGLDDVTDSNFYKTLIAEGKTVPFSGASKNNERQLNAFTKAVSKSIGLNDVHSITPEIIDERFSTLGKQFDNFFSGKKINVGKNFFNKSVTDFVDESADNFGTSTDGYKHTQRFIKEIKDAQKDGIIDGDILGKIRARANKSARSAGNPEISQASREIERFIIDVVGDAHDLGKEAKRALRDTKYKYKNLITIEPLAQKDQLAGKIAPAQLLGRVRQVYKREFSKGKAGELGDLANIGQYIKESIPNSGTSQRTGARNLLTGNIVGALPTYAFGGPLAALAQLGLSGAAMGANRALQSRNFNQQVLEQIANPKSAIFLRNSPAALGGIAGAIGAQ